MPGIARDTAEDPELSAEIAVHFSLTLASLSREVDQWAKKELSIPFLTPRARVTVLQKSGGGAPFFQ